MLKFCRNKLVSIELKDSDTLVAHGILDDDIYSLKLDVSFGLADLKILSVQGKWNRWTTPECPRATQFLQEAVGLSVRDEGFGQKVFKIIGRKACRHFANLLLECSHSAKEATRLVEWREKQADSAALTFEAYMEKLSVDSPQINAPQADQKVQKTRENHERTENKIYEKVPGQTLIDLHVHTFPASPCSSAPVDELINEAKRIGLDGICLTDHNYVWQHDQIEALKKKHDFLVLKGNEITTIQGDMLVFGLEKDIKGIIGIDALRKEVDDAGGFMIAAHPFRGFLIVGVEQTGLTVDEAIKRPLFKSVDAVEVMNGKVTMRENDFASKVAAGLGYPTTGGSDAHEVFEVGRFATRFFDVIKSEQDLINAMKDGQYSPEDLREEKE